MIGITAFLARKLESLYPMIDSNLNAARIDFSTLDKRLKNIEILVACDVTNPLTGENGATYVFGPQKGGTKEMLEVLKAVYQLILVVMIIFVM